MNEALDLDSCDSWPEWMTSDKYQQSHVNYQKVKGCSKIAQHVNKIILILKHFPINETQK